MGQSKDTSHERRGAKSHTIQFRFRMRCVATSAIHAVDIRSCLGSRVPFCAFALAIFHFFIKSMPYLATVGARSGVLAKWMQWMRLAGWLAGLLARLWCTAGACYFDVFESLATRVYLWTLWRNSGTPFEARPDLPDPLGSSKVPGNVCVCRNKYIKS